MLEKAADYVALDLETTGLNPREDMIIEIGAVKFIGGSRMENFSSFVNPGDTYSAKNYGNYGDR